MPLFLSGKAKISLVNGFRPYWSATIRSAAICSFVIWPSPRCLKAVAFRSDAVVLVGEGKDFLGERVQAVLVGHDQERGHLLVRDLAVAALLEGRGLQRRQQFFRLDGILGRELVHQADALRGGGDCGYGAHAMTPLGLRVRGA